MSDNFKFGWSYSPLRGELYIYDWKGDLAFSVQESELEEYENKAPDFANMDEDQIRAWVEANYADVLPELCAYDPSIRNYTGKYDTYLCSFVHGNHADQCDDQLGDVQGFGWYGLVIGADPDFLREKHNDMTGGEYHYLLEKPHVIMTETERGDVYVQYYATEEAARLQWDKIVTAYDEWNIESGEFLND